MNWLEDGAWASCPRGAGIEGKEYATQGQDRLGYWRGRRIGWGIADRFLAEGAEIALVQRGHLDHADGNSHVLQVHVDVSNPRGPAEAVKRTAEHFGEIDILVNGAGIVFERSIATIRPEEWEQKAINLRAPPFLAQAALPHGRQRRGDINTGSIEGLAANPGHAASCGSRAGIHGMTRAVAVDLGGDHVRCNAIGSGWIVSEMSELSLESMSDPVSAREVLNRLHPAGRLGCPEDVGNLAVYLASDRASFLTGEAIVLDEGRTARLPLPS